MVLVHWHLRSIFKNFQLLQRHTSPEIFAFITSILVTVLVQSAKKPKLIAAKSSFNKEDAPDSESENGVQKLLKAVPMLKQTFYPHPSIIFPTNIYPLLRGVIATSHLGILMPYHAALNSLWNHSHHFIEHLPPHPTDGGIISLNWFDEAPVARGETITLVFPGMNNSSETGFVRRLANIVADDNRAGHHTAIVDYRGIGGNLVTDLTTPRPACADGWGDFDHVSRHGYSCLRTSSFNKLLATDEESPVSLSYRTQSRNLSFFPSFFLLTHYFLSSFSLYFFLFAIAL
jgi:hypothetical protein